MTRTTLKLVMLAASMGTKDVAGLWMGTDGDPGRLDAGVFLQVAAEARDPFGHGGPFGHRGNRVRTHGTRRAHGTLIGAFENAVTKVEHGVETLLHSDDAKAVVHEVAQNMTKVAIHSLAVAGCGKAQGKEVLDKATSDVKNLEDDLKKVVETKEKLLDVAVQNAGNTATTKGQTADVTKEDKVTDPQHITKEGQAKTVDEKSENTLKDLKGKGSELINSKVNMQPIVDVKASLEGAKKTKEALAKALEDKIGQTKIKELGKKLQKDILAAKIRMKVAMKAVEAPKAETEKTKEEKDAEAEEAAKLQAIQDKTGDASLVNTKEDQKVEDQEGKNKVQEGIWHSIMNGLASLIPWSKGQEKEKEQENYQDMMKTTEDKEKLIIKEDTDDTEDWENVPDEEKSKMLKPTKDQKEVKEQDQKKEEDPAKVKERELQAELRTGFEEIAQKYLELKSDVSALLAVKMSPQKPARDADKTIENIKKTVGESITAREDEMREIRKPQEECLKLGSGPECAIPQEVSEMGFQCTLLDGVYKPGCDAEQKFPDCFVKMDEPHQEWEGRCVAISTEDFDEAKAKVQAA